MSSNKTKKVIKTKLTNKNGNMPQGKMAEKTAVAVPIASKAGHARLAG